MVSDDGWGKDRGRTGLLSSIDVSDGLGVAIARCEGSLSIIHSISMDLITRLDCMRDWRRKEGGLQQEDEEDKLAYRPKPPSGPSQVARGGLPLYL